MADKLQPRTMYLLLVTKEKSFLELVEIASMCENSAFGIIVPIIHQWV